VQGAGPHPPKSRQKSPSFSRIAGLHRTAPKAKAVEPTRLRPFGRDDQHRHDVGRIVRRNRSGPRTTRIGGETTPDRAERGEETREGHPTRPWKPRRLLWPSRAQSDDECNNRNRRLAGTHWLDSAHDAGTFTAMSRTRRGAIAKKGRGSTDRPTRIRRCSADRSESRVASRK